MVKLSKKKEKNHYDFKNILESAFNNFIFQDPKLISPMHCSFYNYKMHHNNHTNQGNAKMIFNAKLNQEIYFLI